MPPTSCPRAPYRVVGVALALRRRLSPSLLRLTFTGLGVEHVADHGLDQRVTLVLPDSRHSGPSGGIDSCPPAGTGRLLLLGDESAVPAVAGILERLPATACGEVVAALRRRLVTHDG